MKKEHIFKDGLELKECSTCKELKELKCFSRNSKSHDGLKPYCKQCASEKGKKYRNKYREKVLQGKKDWYKNTKDKAELRSKREKLLIYKVCTKCNNEKPIESFRERANGGFYSVCRECENRKNKEYAKNNPDIIRRCKIQTEQRRRKNAKENTFDLTQKQWKECKEFFGNKCAYCGKELKKLCREHVIPLSKGGGYTKNNIIPACRNCNSKKHNKSFLEWYKKTPMYSKEREEKILKYINQSK